MSRNRVIYQSEALFASKEVDSTGRKDHSQLRRVQSANYSFNVARTDVNQFGQLSRIDSIILEAPTVSADISYFLSDGYNEEVLKFSNSNLDVGFVSGQITSTSGQNLYIATSPEGKDANFSREDGYGTIGIGNAYVTDYSFEASVGSFPTVNVSFEGSNINGSSDVTGGAGGFSGNLSGAGIDPANGTPLSNQIDGDGIQIRPAIPATDSAPTALRPSDIAFDLESADGKTIASITSGANGAHVQSVSLSIPLSRTPIERLGTRFPFARVVDFPITPTLSVSAVINETQQKSLTDVIASDGFIPSATITLQDQASTDAIKYKLTNLKLDSESFSSSVGPNKTVDLEFSLSIGGPDDLTNNVFFSGSNTDTVNSLNEIFFTENLAAGDTVTINDVSFESGDGTKSIGFNHGEQNQEITVTYNGDDDLDFTAVSGADISGTAANIITGSEGVATTFTLSPSGTIFGTENIISGTISLSEA